MRHDPIEFEIPPGSTVFEHTKKLVGNLLRARHKADFLTDTYFDGGLKQLMPSPFSIDGMAKATQMILDAIAGRKKISVCSDYDADGVTSAAIVTLTLQAFGVRANRIVIPDRFIDGHGLSDNVVQQVIESQSDLLIVLDFGTTGTHAVETLCASGLQVIAADHHHADGKPSWPEKAILLNPGIPGGVVPGTSEADAESLGDLCAAGLSLILAIALRRAANRPDMELKQQLGLAALGTVADMVPLIHLNRAIVRAGLPNLAVIPGVRAIAQQSRVNIFEATARHCGFVFGPCLNAAGRISHAGLALDLLLATDDAEAGALASEVVALNLERRALQENVTKSCLAAIADRHGNSGIIVQSEEFHPGVIGLAASRLLEMTRRPSIVIGQGGVASARSPETFHIGDFIAQAKAKKLLVNGGGHAAAGGFRLRSLNGHFETFRAMFEEQTQGVMKLEDLPSFSADAANIDADFDMGTLFTTMLMAMEPIGIGNETPLIEIRNVDLKPGRVFGQENQHASMFALIGKSPVQVSIFNYAKLGLSLDKLREARRASFIRGLVETGYPNPKVSPGRINLRQVKFHHE